MASGARAWFPPSASGGRPAIQAQEAGTSWYLGVLKKYAVFSGWARRKEFWMFTLVTTIIVVVLAILDLVITGWTGMGSNSILSSLYGLALFLPSPAVAVRRLHDTGRKGWWYLIGWVPQVWAAIFVVFFTIRGGPPSPGGLWYLAALAPLVGAIVYLVFLVTDSQPHENSYGPDPKAGER